MQRERLLYEAPWPVYAMGWANSSHPERFRMAIGSFIEEYQNKMQIVGLQHSQNDMEEQEDEQDDQVQLTCLAQADHPYPMTKVQWCPVNENQANLNMLATSGDYLRLWKFNSDEDGSSGSDGSYSEDTNYNKLSRLAVLNSNKNNEYCAPITSFDWNSMDISVLGTASVDTTCTIWNVERQQVKTQLIAHDREVYDLAFSSFNPEVFASVGADGSMRMFDLRNLEHSNILYETVDQSPLLRLCWNKLDSNLIATFQHGSSGAVVVVDIRMPATAYCELSHGINLVPKGQMMHQTSDSVGNQHHQHQQYKRQQNVNGIEWSAGVAHNLCSVGQDGQALVWDLDNVNSSKQLQSQQQQYQQEQQAQQQQQQLSNYSPEPVLCYNAQAEINQVSWSTTQPEWLAISHDNILEMLRV
ncbi:hypothetical protein MIR68_006186 [Amoeboaphelidium protococcarum]|nr:hypothetical protein MIR68_006186 [Amoeboaphelidium protococcarum]